MSQLNGSEMVLVYINNLHSIMKIRNQNQKYFIGLKSINRIVTKKQYTLQTFDIKVYIKLPHTSPHK